MKPTREKKQGMVFFRGKEYDSVAKLACELNIRITKINYMIGLGYSLEGAIEDIENNVVVDHTGEEFTSYKEMFDAYGVEYHKGLRSIKRNNGDIEKVLTA